MAGRLAIPGYAIEAEVGRGGMGVVYRARQQSMDRAVAIKVLPPATARNPTFVERFLREARAAAKLNHENVVAAIDAGRASEFVYFVMEFVDGETVQALIERNGKLAFPEALSILIQVVRALDHAHRHGLVHRDVKPENVIIARDGRAKLCDLGLARLAPPPDEAGGGAAGGGEMKTGVAVGTPYYCAPEQARGLVDIDIRADLYALGASAYHMLAGERPFDGGDAREILWKQVNRPFPALEEKRDDLPKPFLDLLPRLVEKDRDARPATPADVLAALEAIRDEIEGRAPAGAGRSRRPGSSSERRLAAPVTSTAAPPPEKSSTRALALVGGVVIVAAVGFGLFKILGGRDGAGAAPGDGGVAQAEPARGEPAAADATPAATGTVTGATDTGSGPGATPTSAGSGRDTAREAEAALKLRLAHERSGPSPADIPAAIARYRDVIAKFEGTPAAIEAQAEVKRLEALALERLDQELARLAEEAKKPLAARDFLSAAALYAPLATREKGGKGEARVADAIARIETACARALAETEAAAKTLRDQGRFDDAAAALEDFARRATGPSKASALTWAEDLRRLGAEKGASLEVELAVGEARDLLSANDPAGAEAALAKALADRRLASGKGRLEAVRREVALFQAAARRLPDLEAKLKAAAEVPLATGERLDGRVQQVDWAAAMLAVKVDRRPAAEGVPLASIDGAFLASLLAVEDTAEGHLGAFVLFLRRGIPHAAAVELAAARARGAGVDEALAKECAAAVAAAREKEAAALLERGKAAAVLEDLDDAVALLKLLRARYADTAFLKTNDGTARETYRDARSRQLVAGPVQAFFAGKVEARKGKPTKVTYAFDEAAEAGDFVADVKVSDKASVKVDGGTLEAKGRVLWKAHLAGDALVDLVVRGATRGNVNVVLYDRGRWLGWFTGIQTKYPDRDNLRASKRAPDPKVRSALFGMPANVIGRGGGAFDPTEWFWASRGPTPPRGAGAFRVQVQAAGGQIVLRLDGKVLGVAPIPEVDQEGGVALWPFAENIIEVEEMRITGDLDPAWLKAEALAIADRELVAPSAPPPGPGQ